MKKVERRSLSKFSLYFCVSFFGFYLLFGALIYLTDPIMYYRRYNISSLYRHDRWQVAGFIRTVPFDTAVLGTSITQNFALSEIKKYFKNSIPIRLSIAGSTIQEQAIVLRSALRKRQLRNIIWALDCHLFYVNYFNYDRKKVPSHFPIDLYIGGFMGHLNYLFNIDSLVVLLEIFIDKLSLKDQTKISIENYNMWGHKFVYSRQDMLKQHQIYLSSYKHTSTLDLSKTSVIQNFYADVLDIVKQNPSVKFFIYLPPYALTYHKEVYCSNPNNRLVELKFRQIILAELVKQKNVYIFDFDVDKEVVCNLDNYKDLMHHSPAINSYILKSMHDKKNLVTSDNLQKIQDKFKTLHTLDFR